MALLAVVGFLGACQPEDVTGARDQLGRGDPRTVSFRIPVVQEAYDARRFLGDALTRIRGDGLIIVLLSPDSVPALVGSDLLDDGEARIEAWDEVDRSAVELGELEDALAASEVLTAPIQMSLRSSLDVPLRVIDPFLAAVRLDTDGEPVRDASGELDLEEDENGRPLTVPLAETAGDSVILQPGEQIRVEREGAPLIDRILELVVGGERIAAVLGGTGRVSDEDRLSVEPSDHVVLGYRLQVGLDLVLPDTGVVLRRTELGEGASLSDRDAEDAEDRAIRAGGTLIVNNGVPFRVQTQIAWIPGRQPEANVFGDPDRVTLDSLSVGTGTVGEDGRVTRDRQDTLQVSLTGAEVKPLLKDSFTAGIRIRLLPPDGPRRRGVLTVNEDLEVDLRAFIDLRSGG